MSPGLRVFLPSEASRMSPINTCSNCHFDQAASRPDQRPSYFSLHMRSVNMLTVEWMRGVIVTGFKCAAALVLSMPLVASAAAVSDQPSAELSTVAGENGQAYFALSMTPPATAQQPRDVVILFDTS